MSSSHPKEATSHARAIRDAWLGALVVITGGLICVRWDTAERLTAGVLRWEWLQLDDLLLTSFIAISALTWFATRRLTETRHALALHLASEHENAKYVAKLEELSAQLLQTEQAERARIGELLHDEVGQTLYACRLQLERALSRASDPALRELVAEAHMLAGDAMSSTRELTTRISPPVLHDLGLPEAIEWLLARTEQRFGVQTHFESSGPWHAIDEALHEPVFHSVSELITNAVKHAQAANIRVDARSHAEHIEVRVHDDGRGFAPEETASRGFGLFSIEQRMARIGAQLHIASANQQGTCVALQLRSDTN
ncbi:MAG TPA: sensor histidine kinase [Polyangiales bacterium]|jgi:signal transduction histidine kinase|nr:sensor histidine kinase [Polyangiales bacterium]